MMLTVKKKVEWRLSVSPYATGLTTKVCVLCMCARVCITVCRRIDGRVCVPYGKEGVWGGGGELQDLCVKSLP